MRAQYALQKLLSDYQFTTVLDIGSGDGKHAREFKAANKVVTTIALDDADVVGDYNGHHFNVGFQCVWASHVLEHQLNVNQFLKKVYSDLLDEGVLAITVPPLKHEIVGGHVTLWNAGLLLYNLILAGFDCRDASVKSEGYDISVIVVKKPLELPRLAYDSGDIDRLAEYFPIPVSEAFDGRLTQVNW